MAIRMCEIPTHELRAEVLEKLADKVRLSFANPHKEVKILEVRLVFQTEEVGGQVRQTEPTGSVSSKLDPSKLIGC
jgi:hypothetical protein